MEHEKETIQMVGQADDILVALCLATRMGRGRVIAAALEHMMNAFVEQPDAPTIQQIVKRLVDGRAIPDVTHDAIEIAKMQMASSGSKT